MLQTISVLRLVTYARLTERTASRFSVALEHVARLADGREVPLLRDRGFSGTTSSPSLISAREQLELDARTCVGPDEPVGRQTWEQVDAWHRQFIAERLQQAGVTISAEEVGRLAHDVILDEEFERALA